MKKLALLSAVAALGLGAAASQAAVLHVTAQITQMTNLNAVAGSSTNPATIAAAKDTAAPHDYKITYYIHTDGLTGNEVGFGNLAMNVDVAGGLARSTVAAHINYVNANSSANEFGNPGSLILSISGDQGSSTTDLQGIVASVPSGLSADGSADDSTRNYRLAAINDGAIAIGSVWVAYNGGARTTITPDVYQWSTSVGDPSVLTFMGANGIDISGASVAIGAVPEPASLGLLGLGGLALAARRRRA